MNGFSENPFFFFVDNAHPMFPMDVYQDVGKIIELSDTGCDAISPSSSIGQKNDETRPNQPNQSNQSNQSNQRNQPKKTPRPRGFSFSKEELKKERNVLPEDKTLPRKPKTKKEFTEGRSKIVNTEINENIDQWERSHDFADFENTLLRNERNFANYDYSSWIENDVIDPDLIFINVPNYSMDKESNLKNEKEENERRRKMSDSYKNWNESKSTRRSFRTGNSNELRKLEKGNKKNRISSASRSAQKEEENKYKIVSDDVRDDPKISLKKESKDFNGEIRKTIDRAVDKDSLSVPNNSDIFGIFEESMKNNMENLNKGESLSLEFNTKEGNFESIEKSKENVHRRRRFNRETNNKTDASDVRKISKSADFDKSKRRTNRSWVRSSRNNSTIPKIQEKKSFPDKEHLHKTNNDNSRSKIQDQVSNDFSAGSPSRRVEETIRKEKMEEKINTASINIEESYSWRNKNRISGNSLARSVLEEKENDKAGIRKKDLDKIGAIFLASSLRKSGKLANSKTADNCDRNWLKNNKSDRLETSKTSKEKTQFDRMLFSSEIRPTISNLSQLPSKTEKLIKSMKSRIPIAISRIKKELEDNVDYFKLQDCNRSRSRLRSKSIVTETDRSNENKIDESTSTAIILVDKSDCTRDEDNTIKDDRLGTGLRHTALNTKLEESRRKRKMDVESKVLKMANDVKQTRREKFEKCGLREPLKKLINESQEIVDIAVTILEKDTKREGKGRESSNVGSRLENDYRNDYRNHEEVYSSKPYSLRSGMYSKYLTNHFPFERYRT